MNKERYILYKISKRNIKTIIRRAFLDGIDWTTCKEDTEKKIKESTRKIMRIISKLKIKEEK